MSWQDSMALGVAEMDATHREFLTLTDALAAAPDSEFPALFAELREHTRAHFENEDRLMVSCRFSATGEHRAEHLRVLGEMSFIGRGVAAGRLKAGREYVRGLPVWFATHLLTMDAALAARINATRG